MQIRTEASSISALPAQSVHQKAIASTNPLDKHPLFPLKVTALCLPGKVDHTVVSLLSKTFRIDLAYINLVNLVIFSLLYIVAYWFIQLIWVCLLPMSRFSPLSRIA